MGLLLRMTRKKRTLDGLVKFLESDGVHGAAAEDDEEEEDDDDLGHDEL